MRFGRSIADVYRDLPHVLPYYERALAGEATEAKLEAAGRTLHAHLQSLDVTDILADDLERVYQRGEHDNGRAMLVIVEDGNVELFL